MNRFFLVIFIFEIILFGLLFTDRLIAQPSQTLFKDEKVFQANSKGTAYQRVTPETAASNWFDVTYYRLNLNVITSPSYLKGRVTISGICRTSNAQNLTLDLINRMQIDSVLDQGIKTTFIQYNNSFGVQLNRSYFNGEKITLEIFYAGLPIPTGFGSFIFSSHNGVPWVYSLSQPYGAKDWWPCKDDPSDKADSADVIVTCDSTFKVGSQGILVSVTNNNNGTNTYHWSERYPIASYLISIAVTDYAQFSNWFKYTETDSMEVLNYVLPEHYSLALQNLPRTINMLKIFSDLFGLYPFIKEKYGHAEFGSGGAMEHQTMTSTTTFNENTISHELAHQWFGDMITCRTWADLWLNEGFAQYSTALYRERQYGMSSYWEYMNSQIDQAKLAYGEIGIPDTSSVRNLFDSHRIYSKGACVLHMLRHVLGNNIFFKCLYDYANHPALKYSTAVINDFQSVCESVSGINLQYFFSQWIYGEGFPEYNYEWRFKSEGDSSFIVLDIEQPIGKINPTFFTMPIDIRVTSTNHDTTITLNNNASLQSFIINFPEKPIKIVLDPEGWILKSVYSINDRSPLIYKLEQNFPNPFSNSTTIAYKLPKKEKITLKIFDILGRNISTLVDETQHFGYYEYQWNSINYASGIYFYQLITGSVCLQKKMVLIR